LVHLLLRKLAALKSTGFQLLHPDPQKREFSRKKFGIRHDDIVTLFAGRLVPVKGITHFIKVAKMLAKKGDNRKFLIAGEGVLRAKLEEETSKYRSSIKFVGWQDDMPTIMNAADIFVLSSLSEGCPNAVLEACACGKPVVATNVGAASDIILNGETGLLVEPRNVEALKDALERIINSRHKMKMGEKAMRRVRKHFTWDAIISKCEKAYHSTLKSGNV